MSEGAGLHEAEKGGTPMIAEIYARLNIGAVDRALQHQADWFIALEQGPTVVALEDRHVDDPVPVG